MSFANIGAAVANLVAHAKSVAPGAADQTEQLAAEVFHHLQIQEQASAPVVAEAVTAALPIGEMALGGVLTAKLGPLLGPAASATADFIIGAGLQALTERMTPTPPKTEAPAEALAPVA